MAKKEITIKEIAKMSGVSTSTVSRVLNHQAHVNPAKRQKVEAIIAESGFRPSMLARGMVSAKTNTFGVVVSDITNPYFTALVAQIEAVAEAAGYSLFLFNTMTAGQADHAVASQVEINAFESLEEKKVDGVLILGGEIDRQKPETSYQKALSQLCENVPTVIVAQPLAGIKATFIPRFQEESASTITMHLLASGYRDLAFLGGEPGITITKERLDGFKKTMQIYAKVDANRIFLNNYYTKDGYAGMQALLRQKPRPNAAVAINDQVALGAIRALNDAGLNCPQDMAIASCDHFPNSDYFTPRLTTMDHHNEALAKRAVAALLNLINQTQKPLPPLPHPTLLIRDSSGHRSKEQA